MSIFTFIIFCIVAVLMFLFLLKKRAEPNGEEVKNRDSAKQKIGAFSRFTYFCAMLCTLIFPLNAAAFEYIQLRADYIIYIGFEEICWTSTPFFVFLIVNLLAKNLSGTKTSTHIIAWGGAVMGFVFAIATLLYQEELCRGVWEGVLTMVAVAMFFVGCYAFISWIISVSEAE